MANVLSGNSYFVDTGSASLNTTSISIVGILITGSGGNGELVLANNDSGASYPTKMHLHTPSGTTDFLDLSSTPVFFPSGIRVVTATNCAATIIFKNSGA